MPAVSTRPSLQAQAERLIQLGVPDLGDISAEALRAAAAVEIPDSLLVISPHLVPASALAPLVTHGGKPGFLAPEMSDLDEFTPIPEAELPAADIYLLTGVDRGDHMSNWSPNEALPAIVEAGRTPLTLSEGIQWLLHEPTALERNRCFMTIGSRRRKTQQRLDARTPAIWISNGTGHDGPANRDAPKIGWCWAGNRHTWLGFASASQRQVPLAGR